MENRSYEKILSIKELKELYPLDEVFVKEIRIYREEIKKILKKESKKKIVIVGPCSVHNINETIEYAKKLKSLSEKIKDKIFVVMRVYLEKPRSTLGWKGFINDPFLDGSFNINEGLKLSRKLLLEITKLRLPIATEFLDVLVYPYIEEFISWASIGARTSESQVHRQFVSGLDIPVGFKNSTSGNIEVAINAVISAASIHAFIGVNEEGEIVKILTKGNPYCHIILRGGFSGPNYEEDFVKETLERLKEKNLPQILMIDCSHGNSLKNYKNQSIVFREVLRQMKNNKGIIGLMLESYLKEGNQKIDLKDLKKGVSITDSCIGWEETEKLLLEMYENL